METWVKTKAEPVTHERLNTSQFDNRFTHANQTKHCWTLYNEFFRCKAARSGDDDLCKRFKKSYRAICPDEWVEKWDAQREAGTFAGPGEGGQY